MVRLRTRRAFVRLLPEQQPKADAEWGGVRGLFRQQSCYTGFIPAGIVRLHFVQQILPHSLVFVCGDDQAIGIKPCMDVKHTRPSFLQCALQRTFEPDVLLVGAFSAALL